MDAETFWTKVATAGECWVWTGYRDADGYGRLDEIRAGKRRIVGAHRRAWELLIGPIPKGQKALHGCDNPSCVRPHPEHVHLGTMKQNSEEMIARGRSAREWRQPACKISDEAARSIAGSTDLLRVLAATHGLSIGHVSDIRRGRARLHALRESSPSRDAGLYFPGTAPES